MSQALLVLGQFAKKSYISPKILDENQMMIENTNVELIFKRSCIVIVMSYTYSHLIFDIIYGK